MYQPRPGPPSRPARRHSQGGAATGGPSNRIASAQPDPFTVRMFLEGIPTAATASEIAIMQSVGGENDGLSRQRGRFVAEVAPLELTGMNIRLIWRRDRYLRGSDHLSFQGQGYAAARFTEPRENFDHEHQNVQVQNGVQFGDLIQYVDFDYVARVAGVNAAALWALATSPSTPKNLQIHATPPPTLAGTNLTIRPRPRTGPRPSRSAASRATSPRTTSSSACGPWTRTGIAVR
ncbi:MAG: hypothetical protein ACRDRJ_24955 [Streptosporangiaceae bacterium]